MDQLRKVWGWLQRQHFWVLIVVVVLVAAGCWFRGASALWREYDANRKKIEAEFTAAQTVRSKSFHPNEKVQTAQNEQIAEQQKAVNALWQQLYERQTATVLKWPSNLSREFRNWIAKRSFGAEIPRNLRAHYNNYIRDHFPELPKIVGALVDDSQSSGGGEFGRGGGSSFNFRNFLENQRGGSRGRGGPEGGAGETFEEPDFLVIWADQQLIRDELAPRNTPTSKRIWKTQEDLWVYEALLQIIASTNKQAGADRFSNAAVRVIESLEVGRTAALASRGKGRIDLIATAPAGGELGAEGMVGEDMAGRGMGPEGGGEFGGRGMEGFGPEMYSEGRGMGMEGANADADLFNNRYVDAAGAPIADAGDGTAATGEKEFKRLPVRMRLWMDQRWLPQLVAECANAPLQVEVQEVRINPADDGSGGGMSRGEGFGRGMGRGEYSQGPGATSVEMAPEAEPNMKTVVIQGVVYIFNPPTEEPAADSSLATAGVQ